MISGLVTQVGAKTLMMDLKNTIIGLAVSAVIAFGAGWMTNGWRLNAEIDRIEGQYAKDLAVANAQALARYVDMERVKQDAINEATRQAQVNETAASAARSELERLRLHIASSSVSTATCSSVRQYSSTLQTVFRQCSEQLEKMAANADGHALDSRTLNASWPKQTQ